MKNNDLDPWVEEGPMSGFNGFNRDFDKHFDEMEKRHKTGERLAIGVIIAAVVGSLALTGAVIWGIVKLVQHFT